MRTCCAFGCSNAGNKEGGLSLHRFPRNENLQKLWILALKRKKFKPSLYSLVCSEHFKVDDFDRSSKLVRLKKGVVPSVFNAFPEYLKKVRTPRKSLIRRATIIMKGDTAQIEPQLKIIQTSIMPKISPKKNLECLRKFTNIAQNVGSLIPPLSPPSVPASLDCSDPNESSRNSISAHSVSYCQSPFESFALQNPVTAYNKIIETNPNLEKSNAERLPCCLNGTLSYELSSIMSSSKEKCLQLNDCMENPRAILPVDVITVMLDDQNLKEFRNKEFYGKVVNISLANNDISELRWFVNIPNLINLNLKKNKLFSVKDLNLLGHAANIDLSNNLIQSLLEFVPIPAKTYENMQSLNLSGNLISEIVDLTVLCNLNDLNLSNNYIKSLKNFKRFLPNSLSKISLEGNYISDWNDFNELTAIQNLKNISVHNNPCFQIYVSALVNNKSDCLLHNIDFIPFLIIRFPHVTTINGKVITTEDRNVARMLITKERILSPEFNDKNLLLSCLADCFMKTDEELIKLKNISDSKEFLPVKSLIQNSDITYERDNYECFSASCSRNKNAMEEKSRQNFIGLIEERARSYKLTREVETLKDKIHCLETFLSQNALSMNDIIIKTEEEEPEMLS